MDLTAIMQVISSVGFPIAMCLMMAWYIKATNESYRSDIKSLQASIDSHTATLQKLINKLEVTENVKGD